MDRRYMSQAIELAVENARSGNGGPFAALVVKNGEVIGTGVNCVTSTNDPTAHAEVTAIRAACRKLGDFQLSGCEIYTSCEPCPMCLGAIYWARPARVYYAASSADAAAAGFDDSRIYEQIAVPGQDRDIPLIHDASADGGRPFREWRDQPTRRPY